MTPTSIVFEHIHEGNHWVCWQIVSDGSATERTWMHKAMTYEESIAIARNIRINYDHLPGYRGVQTIHLCR